MVEETVSETGDLSEDVEKDLEDGVKHEDPVNKNRNTQFHKPKLTHNYFRIISERS